jgi:hypothetical protein
MLLDRISGLLSQVRGLPVLLAIGMVLLNFLFQFINVPVIIVLAETNLFLHLAVIVGLTGVLLADALGAW